MADLQWTPPGRLPSTPDRQRVCEPLEELLEKLSIRVSCLPLGRSRLIYARPPLARVRKVGERPDASGEWREITRIAEGADAKGAEKREGVVSVSGRSRGRRTGRIGKKL